MSDAAQKAVDIIAPHDLEYSDFIRRWRCGCGVEFSDFAKKFVRLEWAAHVLAVLSETHAVVELPEDDNGYEYTLRQNNMREGDSPYIHGVLDRQVATNVAAIHPEVSLVRRVYGPWTPVAEGGGSRG